MHYKAPVNSVLCSTIKGFLLLRWGETMSLWNWASNGPTVHPPNDTCVNMEQRWNDNDRGKLKVSEKSRPIAGLSTTNPTWTALGANPSFRDASYVWCLPQSAKGWIYHFPVGIRHHNGYSLVSTTLCQTLQAMPYSVLQFLHDFSFSWGKRSVK
jgi:hypothetical protein